MMQLLSVASEDVQFTPPPSWPDQFDIISQFMILGEPEYRYRAPPPPSAAFLLNVQSVITRSAA
jgi:hypothetical protein